MLARRMMASEINNNNSGSIVSRYWKLNITATELSGTGAGYINCDVIGLNAIPGDNTNQVPAFSATAVFSQSSIYTSSYGSSNAWLSSDEHPTTQTYFWHSANQNPAWWTTLDLGAGNSIGAKELALRGCNLAGRMPRDFEVQISSDGVVWQTVMSYSGVTGWDNNVTTKLFNLLTGTWA
ncbi:MAG: discoidin domain-containing protein [Sulfuriferula sp.]